LRNGLESNHSALGPGRPGKYCPLCGPSNSDAAARLGYELIVRAESLVNFPEMGHSVPEFKQETLREITCRSYRIIYRLRSEQQCIDIIRIWHAARGFPNISAES
jgi:toxin ParE1/3/4